MKDFQTKSEPLAFSLSLPQAASPMIPMIPLTFNLSFPYSSPVLKEKDRPIWSGGEEPQSVEEVGGLPLMSTFTHERSQRSDAKKRKNKRTQGPKM